MGGMSGHVFPSHCMATWLCSSGFQELAVAKQIELYKTSLNFMSSHSILLISLQFRIFSFFLAFDLFNFFS